MWYVEVLVKTSTIANEKAGVSCFSSQRFQKGGTIRHYDGTLFYNDLSASTDKVVLVDDGMMPVTKAGFSTLTIYLESRVSFFGGETPPIWILPAKFNECSLHKTRVYFLGSEQTMEMHIRSGLQMYCLLRKLV